MKLKEVLEKDALLAAYIKAMHDYQTREKYFHLGPLLMEDFEEAKARLDILQARVYEVFGTVWEDDK